MNEEDKKDAGVGEDMLDISMFITDEGANMLSTEQLNEINKMLPKWSIEPPSKYKK